MAFAGGEAGHRHAARVNPDSHSRSRKFGIGSRFGSRFGSDFQKIGSGFENLEKSIPILTPDPENSGSGAGSGAVSGVTFRIGSENRE